MPHRIRDPRAHRAAILEAARASFTERGYARTTIREVAARAGVTHGLVMRHFSSKEELFVAAMPGPADLDALVAGDRATLARRLAEAFVDELDSGEAPLIALIRSVASGEESALRLHEQMQARSRAAYRQIVQVPDADTRIELLHAHLTGIAFHRRVSGVGPLAEMPREELVGHVERAIRTILLDDAS
ncbi:TetR family transcriptional regulator [Catenulispora sp. EB89]|uniref:TetR/AcrR family transcriptional regulator n=1 Tax=Catenulispora sp. EB89 TaxID=3156257 RepID=UPI0035126F0D